MGRVIRRHRLFIAASALAVGAFALVACSESGEESNPASGGSGGQGAGSGGKASSGGSTSTGGSSGAGKGGTAGSGGTASGVSTDEFWLGLASALCQRYRSCANDESSDYGDRARLLAMGSEEECAGLLQQVLERSSRSQVLNEGVAAGALTLNGELFEECFGAAALCEYPNGDPLPGHIFLEDVTPCREVFEGKVAAGGDCDLTEECAGDAMCVRHDPDAGLGPCAGICQPRLAEGEECVSSRQCAGPSGSWPSCDSNSNECRVQVIDTPAPAGGMCNGWADRLVLCEEGWWCNSGNCYPFQPDDGECDEEDDNLDKCETQLCDIDTCTEVSVVSEVGASCDDDTTICNIFEGLVCSIDGQCMVNAGSEDDGCFDFRWYERVLCDPPTLGAEGDYCSSSENCESGICRYPNGCGTGLCSLP